MLQHHCDSVLYAGGHCSSLDLHYSVRKHVEQLVHTQLLKTTTALMYTQYRTAFPFATGKTEQEHFMHMYHDNVLVLLLYNINHDLRF